ncbi:hypothetical protein JCM5350_001917 [Sporobolomyces pararoseus]
MDTLNTDTDTAQQPDLEALSETLFQQHTRALTLSVKGRDPRDAIEQLEKSIYHGLQGIGLLADRPKWTIMWTILLGYGLWRIKEMDEVAERLGDVKLLIDAFQDEIGPEAAARLLARATSLSRYPGVPHVDGISSSEPHFNWAPHSVFAPSHAFQSDLDSSEDEEMDAEAQEAQEARTAGVDALEIDLSLRISKEGSDHPHDECARDLTGLTITATEVPTNPRIRKAEDSPTLSTPSSLSPVESQTPIRSSTPPASFAVPKPHNKGPRHRPSQKLRISTSQDPFNKSSPTSQLSGRLSEDSSPSQSAMAIDSPSLQPRRSSGVLFIGTAALSEDEVLKVVGSLPELGSWDPAKGLVLTKPIVSAVQSASVRLESSKANESFEWKLVRVNSQTQAVTWEDRCNRSGTRDESIFSVTWNDE